MAKSYEIKVPAHPNIYQPGLRDMNLYFCEPEHGINEDTGLLLLIPGFGGNASSNVYKKMRTTFADKHNLVTIQCDYFGHEFMQVTKNATMNIDLEMMQKTFSHSELQEIISPDTYRLNFKRLVEIGAKYDLIITGKENLGETIENFNDMGIMQALDNLTAILLVMAIIKDNGYSINTNRIIAYGHSHGAYLALLCNAFAPRLFSKIIDNSAWLFPVFLLKPRYYLRRIGNLVFNIEFQYLAKDLPYDIDLLYLSTLYQKFTNTCDILSFHGTEDDLINPSDKERFCSQIPFIQYHEITPERVDGKIFKSCTHGLDADFLELFDYAMSLKEPNTPRVFSLPSVSIDTLEYSYSIEYSTGVPIMEVRNK
ncbi:DUF2920 family protein [Effusibacillus lacus]|uniref:DUF2920 domain-containing protein n=1 Tax=Effusibacillus lacus TaxID=1348429 RepID=A0A292YJH1_9BACL|nr:DUF2920 family protein [Effusibacillus lacus]TCS69832.1 DUF2920 family protein [Effusibacillus lacus]GAX88913.1 hypothetical protein EFBL_0527 [Effusibacillus lacus]